MLDAPDPFWIRDLAASHFRRKASSTGAYEVSSIKEELETLALRNCQDTGYMRTKAKLGRALADEYTLKRHSIYFRQLLQNL